MVLIVGLGNPGPKYAENRHNIGFKIAERLAEKYNMPSFKIKDLGMMTEGSIDSTKVYVLKPTTYMNKSGLAVSSIAKFYKIPVENIIVIHDDIDLEFGRIKVKQGGGHGGHNGLRDIDAHMGKEYIRVRFGVGHPGERNLVSDYVLHDFVKAEAEENKFLIEHIVDSFPFLLKGDSAKFLCEVNR